MRDRQLLRNRGSRKGKPWFLAIVWAEVMGMIHRRADGEGFMPYCALSRKFIIHLELSKRAV